MMLNTDAAPNYRHMFGPHRGPLPHLRISQSNTYNHTYCDETKQGMRNTLVIIFNIDFLIIKYDRTSIIIIKKILNP